MTKPSSRTGAREGVAAVTEPARRLLRRAARRIVCAVAGVRSAVRAARGAFRRWPVTEPLASLLSRAEVTTLRVSAPRAVTRIEQVCLDAAEHLPAAERSWMDARVETALKGVLGLPEARRAEQLDDWAQCLELEFATKADRVARRRYTGGLLGAVAVSLVFLVCIGVAAVLVIDVFKDGRLGGQVVSEPERYALRDLLVGVGGGSAGAVVSVLVRLSHTARLPARLTGWVRVALVRVALGWFFSAALIFALKGGLLDLFALPAYEGGVPEDPLASWFWWGAVGFLAGFNERWAKNLFTREPESQGSGPSEPGEHEASRSRS